MRTKREYVLILWQGLNVSFYFYAISWKQNRIFLAGHPLKAENVVCFCTNHFGILQDAHALKCSFDSLILSWNTVHVKSSKEKSIKSSLAMDLERRRSGEGYTIACFDEIDNLIMSSLFWLRNFLKCHTKRLWKSK